MTSQEFETYCKDNGVPYRMVGKSLRVMDLSQLPQQMRSGFDERGVYKGVEIAEPVVVEAEVPADEPVVEQEIVTAKKRKK